MVLTLSVACSVSSVDTYIRQEDDEKTSQTVAHHADTLELDIPDCHNDIPNKVP